MARKKSSDQPAKLSPNSVRIQTNDQVNVRLTQAEIAERAIESCKVAQEYEELEAQANSVKTEWKKKLQVVNDNLLSLRRTVRSGEEFRQVDCERVFDTARGTTWLEFEGKKYFERSATNDELAMIQAGSIEDTFAPPEVEQPTDEYNF